MPRKSNNSVAVAPPIAPTPAIASAPRGRASWSGMLRLSLVTVPVKAYPAVSSSETTHFNQLHADCGQRIAYEKHCPIHGRVENAEIAKGYQYAPGQYVVIDAAELESLRSAKDRALSLERFVDARELDPVIFSGRCLYLLPDNPAAQRPYLLLAHAMRERGKWAVGRVAMSGNRQVVVVRPHGRMLAMDVLHDPGQLRSSHWLEAELQGLETSPEELQLAGMLIDSASGGVDWAQYRDDMPEKLAALVEAKVAGREVAVPADEPVQVLKLLDALKQSVAEAQREPAAAKRKTARRSA